MSCSKCASGKMTCTNDPCAATCSASGDRHFTTFDGQTYDFKGACSYVLSEDGCLGKDHTYR